MHPNQSERGFKLKDKAQLCINLGGTFLNGYVFIVRDTANILEVHDRDLSCETFESLQAHHTSQHQAYCLLFTSVKHQKKSSKFSPQTTLPISSRSLLSRSLLGNFRYAKLSHLQCLYSSYLEILSNSEKVSKSIFT